MFKKRKEKLISSDISTIEYWKRYIKPGMKLNNSRLLGQDRYANFITPKKFQIVNNYGTINISFKDIREIDSWYHIYKDGVPVEIIQDDIMSPKDYDLQA